ncbi:acyl-CoA carboxylase epsilon subunit [Streptomyces somaliensis]|uniref:acyl-CoA carboxylase epsilon subunit n=1 Tax=Streptomyces somaliensis TaxID=78355 RepID=UPI00029B029B|nr:acyl-CoA carboxylase epsilon subunit [Streptomyces somaliensis]
MIKVVRGNPTPEELAAALAVVRARAAAAASAGAAGAPARAPEAWSAPARVVRGVPPSPGPRSWARSCWPA